MRPVPSPERSLAHLRDLLEYVLARGAIISHTDLASRPVHKSQTSWYHSDGRGSTIMLTGSNAQISAAYSYDAWGSVYGERPVVGVPRPVVPAMARPAVERATEYLYTGKRLDAETGLADYGFRDYAPALARFTTVDPIRDGRNWFAYVEGDPVNRIDPLGLTPVWILAGYASPDPVTTAAAIAGTIFVVVDELSRGAISGAVVAAFESVAVTAQSIMSEIRDRDPSRNRDPRPFAQQPNNVAPSNAQPVDPGDPSDPGSGNSPNMRPGPAAAITLGLVAGSSYYHSITHDDTGAPTGAEETSAEKSVPVPVGPNGEPRFEALSKSFSSSKED